MKTRLKREDEVGLGHAQAMGLVTAPKESLGPGERGQRAEWGDNRKDFLTGRGRRPGQGKLLQGKEVGALTSGGSSVHMLGGKSQGSAWEDKKYQVTGQRGDRHLLANVKESESEPGRGGARL